MWERLQPIVELRVFFLWLIVEGVFLVARVASHTGVVQGIAAIAGERLTIQEDSMNGLIILQGLFLRYVE